MGTEVEKRGRSRGRDAAEPAGWKPALPKGSRRRAASGESGVRQSKDLVWDRDTRSLPVKQARKCHEIGL